MSSGDFLSVHKLRASFHSASCTPTSTAVGNAEADVQPNDGPAAGRGHTRRQGAPTVIPRRTCTSEVTVGRRACADTADRQRVLLLEFLLSHRPSRSHPVLFGLCGGLTCRARPCAQTLESEEPTFATRACVVQPQFGPPTFCVGPVGMSLGGGRSSYSDRCRMVYSLRQKVSNAVRCSSNVNVPS